MLYSWAETLQCYSVSLYPCIQAAGCEYPLVVSYYSSFSLSSNKHGTKKKKKNYKAFSGRSRENEML